MFLVEMTNDSTVDSILAFDSGYCISRQQLELVYGSHLVKKMLEFAKAFNELKLNDIEIGLVCSILFTSIVDSNNIPILNYQFQSKAQISQINQDLLDSLQFEIRNRKPNNNSSSSQQSSSELNKNDAVNQTTLYKKILEQVDELHMIGNIHSQQLKYYRSHKIKVKLPNLLSEIYEIDNGVSTTTAPPTTPTANSTSVITNPTTPINNGSANMITMQQVNNTQQMLNNSNVYQQQVQSQPIQLAPQHQLQSPANNGQITIITQQQQQQQMIQQQQQLVYGGEMINGSSTNENINIKAYRVNPGSPVVSASILSNNMMQPTNNQYHQQTMQMQQQQMQPNQMKQQYQSIQQQQQQIQPQKQQINICPSIDTSPNAQNQYQIIHINQQQQQQQQTNGYTNAKQQQTFQLAQHHHHQQQQQHQQHQQQQQQSPVQYRSQQQPHQQLMIIHSNQPI